MLCEGDGGGEKKGSEIEREIRVYML